MEKYFKIGELSKLYGIGVDSLRYYEKIGILHPQRSESGYRYYSIQDIWKLNSIRDLRSLGFGMEQIRQYLEHHNVESTLALLQQEQEAIGRKIRELRALEENVEKRMGSLRAAESRAMDQITLEHCPERRCYCIPEGYSQECEMDVLIKRLLNMDRDHLYVIGSNQIGTAISMEEVRTTGKLRYSGVFVVDHQGEMVLPEGNYLTVTYRGSYKKSSLWIPKILEYAKEKSLRLRGDLLEILWIDIHTTEREEEYVTELQVLTE